MTIYTNNTWGWSQPSSLQKHQPSFQVFYVSRLSSQKAGSLAEALRPQQNKPFRLFESIWQSWSVNIELGIRPQCMPPTRALLPRVCHWIQRKRQLMGWHRLFCFGAGLKRRPQTTKIYHHWMGSLKLNMFILWLMNYSTTIKWKCSKNTAVLEWCFCW